MKTIDYKMHYWTDWTVYRQTIKISEDLQKKYNNRLRYLYKKIEEKKNITHTFSCDDMCISLYTKPLKKWVNFLKFTGLYEFYKMILKSWLDTKRLKLDRNTIIEVL
jgi:hypothetical protein